MVEQHKHPEFPRLTLVRTERSHFYHARIYLDGRLKQSSLKTPDVKLALRLAAEWYKRELRASVSFGKQHPIKRLTTDPVLGEVFANYRSTLAEKQQTEATKRWGPIQHFWRTLKLTEITSDTFDQFYRWRKNVKAHTLHKDVCCVRQVLKYAELKTDVGFVLPRIPKHGKIESNPRPWLEQREWDHLRAVSDKRVAAVHWNAKLSRQRHECFEFAAFMVASMCRVEELQSLRFFHCNVETVDKRKILRCEFKGKTGPRVAFAKPEAVLIYLARLKRARQDSTALVFNGHHRDAFRELLLAAGLYEDHFGNRRNYKAMRATSIALALLQPNPPSIYQIALNAGTSVAVIEKFYAKRLTAEHGKDVLTAAEPLPSMWGRKRTKS